MKLEFNDCRPRLWKGRYRRIPGQEPAFYTNAKDEVLVRWTDRDTGDNLESKIEETPAARALGKSVNDLKESKTGKRGGSFLINEFGQVLSPVYGTTNRFIVGELAGVPRFKDPDMPGHWFTLTGEGLELGNAWKYPYIGLAYNLGDSGIYFKFEDDEGSSKQKPTRQDEALIAALRELRPFGVLRFVVNLHGVVLTKAQDTQGRWCPNFVSRINVDAWFERER
jgi:hypothetical protein